MALELQLLIIKELIPLLPKHQLKTLRTTTHLRFMKLDCDSMPTSLMVDDTDILEELCQDIINFECIICRHSRSQSLLRNSLLRNPKQHIVFGNITRLTIPMPSLSDDYTCDLCQQAFPHMRVTDLTLEVGLDDVSFPSVFRSWGDSFLHFVRDLTFDFSAQDLDVEEVSWFISYFQVILRVNAY